ncbi:MAG: hypothetical protein GWP07_01890 [Xanthomonadaceae bacterium]|nr:hypothetical protein [Xanthomonadaceae bacterium]
MSILLAQSWNVKNEREDEYLSFIAEKYNPTVTSLGLRIVGGYYVEVGTGPSTVAVLSADDVSLVNGIVVSEEYRKITNELNFFVNNRRAALGVSTGRISKAAYTIQEGVWKWNHYYNVRPNKKEDYKKFLKQLGQVIDQLDFVELTQEWHMLYGGVADYLLEMTFQDPIDISRLLNSQQFRDMEKLVKKELIIDYSSRILRSTERFEKPRWITL